MRPKAFPSQRYLGGPAVVVFSDSVLSGCIGIVLIYSASSQSPSSVAGSARLVLPSPKVAFWLVWTKSPIDFVLSAAAVLDLSTLQLTQVLNTTKILSNSDWKSIAG